MSRTPHPADAELLDRLLDRCLEFGLADLDPEAVARIVAGEVDRGALPLTPDVAPLYRTAKAALRQQQQAA
jgi:hypothetical protein